MAFRTVTLSRPPFSGSPLLEELALSFTQAVRSVLTQYATFTGRASRAEYWWFFLFTVLLNAVTGIPDLVLGRVVQDLNGFTPFGTVVWLALLVPTLAVSVRRLHDSDLSGWWMAAWYGLWSAAALAMLVAGFVLFDPFSLFVASDPSAVLIGPGSATALAAVAAGGLLLLAGAVLWLVLMLRESTPGANRFGPSPLVPAPGTGPGLVGGPYPYEPDGGPYGPPHGPSPYGAPRPERPDPSR